MALGIIGAIIRVDGHEAHLMIAELAVCVTMYVVDMCVMCMYVQMHSGKWKPTSDKTPGSPGVGDL